MSSIDTARKDSVDSSTQNRSMLLVGTIYLFSILVASYSGHVLLYETTTDYSVDRFDCVHYTNTEGETIPYCRRPRTSDSPVPRTYTTCQNDGIGLAFVDLIHDNIGPHDVIRWSSSIDMADRYAQALQSNFTSHNGHLCNCTKPGTFGKYCQYRLSHEVNSFSSSVDAQFAEYEDSSRSYGWGIQRYGQIICYETLSCNYGLLCLNWHDICDGEQHCIDGFDEENCDKLEFNECNDGEYRCLNGMCIAEEFWLDGKIVPELGKPVR
jgi:hypothetical protein